MLRILPLIRNRSRAEVKLISRYLLAVLVFNLAACASMQTVSVEGAMQNSPPRGIDYGSLVKVTTLDNQKAEFRVTDITETGLGGKPGFYAYENMKELKVEKSGESNTNWTGILMGVLGVAALVLLIDNADSVAVCSPSPCQTSNP